MFHQLNFRVNYADADYSTLHIPDRDREILRGLALRVRELAELPVMAEREALWRAHNSLRVTRPVLLCDPENGWNEIIPAETIRCENSIARYWEMHLRKQIFWGEEIDDDYVVEPVFNLPHRYTEKPWRIRGAAERQTASKTAEEGKAYHIEAVLTDYGQVGDILPPEITVDYATTAALLEQARAIFDGALEVRNRTVWFWSFGLTDDFVFMRGLENLMYDFYDEPERIHQVMGMLCEGTMKKLDFLEENGLLALNNDGAYVGSGGMGFTGELPAHDAGERVRTRDMWGLAESQVTSGVSPELFAEFIFPYQKRLMERFGLTCYGCCEPMDQRIDIVKAAGNLRRVSVSAWADPAVMAEKLGGEYIYSYKPSPSPLALPRLDQDVARKTLHDILRTARDNRLEIVMKDNHTLGGNPQNLTDWVRMAREEIANRG